MKLLGIPLQYACFNCRKCFKRPQFSASSNCFMTSEQRTGQRKELEDFEARREYKCPHCGGSARLMGLDFKAPKMGDAKAWEEVRSYIESGKIYYRNKR